MEQHTGARETAGGWDVSLGDLLVGSATGQDHQKEKDNLLSNPNIRIMTVEQSSCVVNGLMAGCRAQNWWPFWGPQLQMAMELAACCHYQLSVGALVSQRRGQCIPAYSQSFPPGRLQ